MILVTGGAGFIGSNLAAALGARSSSLAICDRVDAAKAENLEGVVPDAVFAPEDLADFLAKEGEALDGVVHLGAISSTTETDEAKLRRTNVALFKWCAVHQVRLLYASSAATYGDGSKGFEDSLDLAYLTSLQPLNPYGRSKNAFDIWVAEQLAAGAPRPPQWAGLKFFNVYGPREAHKGAQASVAWHLFQQLREGDSVRLFKSHNPDYPDGGQLRDFVWVGDCVAVMIWLLEHRRASGLFNVGSGRARSFNGLAKALFAALGREPRIDYVPTPAAIRQRYQYFTEARMERLREIGYFRPFTGLEDGIARYVRDHLMQDDDSQ